MRDKSVEEGRDAIGITSAPEEGISPRLFLGDVGAGIGAVALAGEADTARTCKSSHTAKTSLPMGAPLRVLPVLAYATAQPQDRSSWRPYGAIHSPSDVVDEARRIEAELRAVASAAEFPIEFQPVAVLQAHVTRTNLKTQEVTEYDDYESIPLIFEAPLEKYGAMKGGEATLTGTSLNVKWNDVTVDSPPDENTPA